jgi:hypothetical protein
LLNYYTTIYYSIIMNIYEIQHKLFDYVTFLTYFLYFVVALGLSASAPQYLDDLLFYTKLYISLFLIYRFNPFRLTKFTPLDAKIAYNAGIFLLITVAINSILKTYIDLFKSQIQILINDKTQFISSF